MTQYLKLILYTIHGVSNTRWHHLLIKFSAFYSYTTTTTVLRTSFRDHPGQPVPRRELLDFMVQGKINGGRHTDWCLPPPSPHIFYRLDALPAAQPTASKHWRQLQDARVLLNGATCTVSVPYVSVPYRTVPYRTIPFYSYSLTIIINII